MQKLGRFIQICLCLSVIALGPWHRAEVFAQRVLGGAELENGCQTYADKAVKMAKEWEQRQCKQKLSYAPQLMDTDRTWHYNRCKSSVGTSIDANLKLMEDDLKKCPGDPGQTAGHGEAGTQGGWGGQPGRPNPPQDTWQNNNRRINNGNDNITSSGSGDIWDILVINSADLAQSYHVYRIPSLNGMFTAKNMNAAGGPDFRGQMNGSVFEALMTDNTGYRANFIGHGTISGTIEGTGCDNRNRSFSFTMKRR